MSHSGPICDHQPATFEYFTCIGLRMNNALKYVASILLMMTTISSAATHIVGGELYYEYVGETGDIPANWYRVTLIVYRDCGPTNTNGTDFDFEASIGVFNNGDLQFNMSLLLADANINEIPVELENPCFILPPDVCVQEAIYSQIVELPPMEGGYDLIYQRCCRNPSIVNLLNPEDQGITMWSHVPGPEIIDEDFNSSAVFNNFPPVALCQNALFWFDHSATAPDGDSLVYEFCHPLHGASPDLPAPAPPDPPPFTEVPYAAGFNEAFPITSDPSFTIDPETGWIEGIPTAIGQYVIGVCVSEYRDGELICKNTRDFQFNVTLCDPNIVASIPEQDDLCDGLEVTFENNSVNATSFQWYFNDPLNPAAQSTEANPTYSFEDAGTYGVMLIANPDWPCADTTIVEFTVWPEMEPVIEDPFWECLGGQVLVDWNASGNFQPGVEFDWDFPALSTPGSSNDEDPQNVTFGSDGDQTVQLTTTYNGCVEETEYTFNIPPPPQAIIIDQDTYCDGFTYTFENGSTNATFYDWDFGAPGLITDVSTEFEPTYTYPDVGLYTVTLSAGADFHCPSLDQAEFDVYTLLDPWFPLPDPQCFEGHSFDFAAQGTVNPDAIFLWDFGTTATPSTGNNQVVNGVTWDAAGSYPVTLSIEQDVCLKTYTDTILIIPNPTADFSILNETGCAPYTVTFINESEVQTQAIWEWDFGDGNTANGANPIHVYDTPGTFTVSVTVTTTVGCEDSSTAVLEDLITVYPAPATGFDIEPDVVNILDPTVTVTSTVDGDITCVYFMGDGGQLESCDGDYTYSQGGIMDVVQYVTNEWGCVSSVHGEVLVEGTLFYAPNAFTPNNDGDNDVWLPSVIGAGDYKVEVYNRWGEVIFQSTDPTEPWVGDVKGGDHFAQDGIYLYRIWYRDLVGLAHAFEGHIALIR